jgi:hypothetical protein
MAQEQDRTPAKTKEKFFHDKQRLTEKSSSKTGRGAQPWCELDFGHQEVAQDEKIHSKNGLSSKQHKVGSV